MTDGDLTIHQAIAEVINELEGIGKTGVNEEQHYNYRGIDAVLQSLHPLFGKYGIFMAPEVLERIYEERVSGKGTKGHCAHLHVRYTVYGPMGDSIVLSTWGEGLDYSDKSTNKAMTAAFKYALFQLFAICDPAEDGDEAGPEGGSAAEVEETPLEYLMKLLMGSPFTKAVQSDIIMAAVGRRVNNLGELAQNEIVTAVLGVESALADKQQLEEEKQ